MDLIQAIAMLCLLSTGAYNNAIDAQENMQKKCHVYYAKCFIAAGIPLLGSDILKCMVERK